MNHNQNITLLFNFYATKIHLQPRNIKYNSLCFNNIDIIAFQTAKGDPTICVKLSLCVTSHTAAKTPSSVAALSSGFSAPCSGSRIYTPYRCPCHRLPAFSADGFSGVSHIRAEFRDPHCS